MFCFFFVDELFSPTERRRFEVPSIGFSFNYLGLSFYCLIFAANNTPSDGDKL